MLSGLWDSLARQLGTHFQGLLGLRQAGWAVKPFTEWDLTGVGVEWEKREDGTVG